MVDKREDVTMVVFGRTGAGKSSLGNKIAGRPLFKEGHTMTAETFEATSVNFQWPQDKSINIRFVDTPGFADNRPDVDNTTLLANILKFLKSLNGGFNVGMFCMPVKTRADAHDIEELEMLGTLLGHDVFKHTWIVITQVNTLKQPQQDEAYKKIPNELPGILAKNGIEGFTKDRIIFADFDQFNQQFMLPIHNIVQETRKYKPEITQNLDDPTALSKVMASPAIKAMMQKYEEMFAQKAKELEKLNEVIRESAENNKVLQKQMQKREDDIEKLNKKLENMENNRQQIQYITQQPKSTWHDYVPFFGGVLKAFGA